VNFKKGFLNLVIALSIVAFLSTSIVTYANISYNTDIFWKNVDESSTVKIKQIKTAFENINKLAEKEKEQLFKESQKEEIKLKIITKFCSLSETEQKEVIDLLSLVYDYYRTLLLPAKEINLKARLSLIARSTKYGFYSIIPIWIIYGLILLVKSGFTDQIKKRKR